MPFKYSKVLVLGATSGIGWAMAAKFLSEGSAVIAVGRRQEKLDEFAQKYNTNGKVDTAVFDITDLNAIPQFAQTILSKHPDLDCVMLNSGIQRHLDWTKPESVDLDLMEKEFKTNYTSYMHLTKGLPALFPVAETGGSSDLRFFRSGAGTNNLLSELLREQSGFASYAPRHASTIEGLPSECQDHRVVPTCGPDGTARCETPAGIWG